MAVRSAMDPYTFEASTNEVRALNCSLAPEEVSLQNGEERLKSWQ